MSLINKMLQDLDKRGATPQRPGGTISEVEPLEEEIEESGRGRGKVIAGVVVVALVAVAVAGWWFTLGPGGQLSERVAVVAKPAPAPPAAQPAKPAPAPTPPAPVVTNEQKTAETAPPSASPPAAELSTTAPTKVASAPSDAVVKRSEERRVGKECRL